jgi:NADH/F420H2 dehydrogenase subunit C
MSWELAERLRARFPDVELFPRPGADQPESPARASSGGAPGAESGGEAAAADRPPPARRPAHEQPPQYLTPGVYVPREKLLDVCRVLATDPDFGLTYLSFVSAIDWPERGELEVLYHLYSHRSREELALKVRVPRDDPRVPSVTGIWDGANWHEREAYDLLGVVFEGHPNLRRIMMTEDWIGHPLRKDYVYQDPPWLVEIVRERHKDADGLGLGERA